MIRLLIWAILIYLAYRIVITLFRGKVQHPEKPPDPDKVATAYQDPICGIYVSEENAVIGRLDGQRYYFCSKQCLEKFQEQLENKTT